MKPGKLIGWGLGLLLAVFAFTSYEPGTANAVIQANGLPLDTDIEEPFVQINDVNRATWDSFTIRGKLSATTPPPAAPRTAPAVNPAVTAVLANGGTSTVFESSPSGGFIQVDTFTWDASECKPERDGVSAKCRDADSHSYLLLRGSKKDPSILRISTFVRRRTFVPGKPYNIPLAGEVTVAGSPYGWSFLPDVAYCKVSHNGPRTTCRAPKAGPGV